MSYLALARKYRPQTFDELVGQEVLVTTLSNAIKNNRLHHAYILTGIRGVGKTTTARIIAKTLNCENKINPEIACGTCDNCQAITGSKHQDVIEIDAASKTGVDDIREIIDAIAYAPVMAKYKIYIIDEVHMLSNNAFNALLKTLEEPPVKVKFIFATTEIKKVPITILSRCQRFDLRRLDELEIKGHLQNIVNQEGFKSEEGALEIIAKMSEGSVRDSLSLLDQALATNQGNEELTQAIVEKILGLNDKEKTIELFQNILSGNLENSLNSFNNFYNYSSDISQLIVDLLDLTHKSTMVKSLKNYDLAQYSNSQKEQISKISSKISLSSLTKIWQILNKGKVEMSFATSQKITFEMLLVRICHLISLPNLEDILLSDNKGFSAENNKKSEENSDIAGEILRNFAGAKIV